MYHSRVPNDHIVDCMEWVAAEDGHADGIDIMVIAGDLWDKTVPFGDDLVTPLIAWQVRFLRWCERHRVICRILYGTPRHDRKQSARFYDLIAELGIDVDFKYVSTLSIEHIAEHDINVLYIPDEWRTDPAVTLAEVKQAMAEKHLDKVDFAVMHGCFGFQLPPIESIQAKAHKVDAYLELVRYQIFIGHHHVFATHEIICAQGSLTRLAQGEEGPKGYVVFDLYDDDSWRRTFVENKAAWTFKSINAEDRSFTDVVEELRAMELRKGSYIDIVAEQGTECSNLFKWIVKEFPGINFVLKRPKKKADPKSPVASLATYSVPQINKGNVVSHISEWLAQKGESAEMIQKCCEVLEHERDLLTEQP